MADHRGTPADLPADRRRQEHDASDPRGGGHGFVPAGRHTARTVGARAGVSVPAAGPGRPLFRDDPDPGLGPHGSDGGRLLPGPAGQASAANPAGRSSPAGPASPAAPGPAVMPGTGRRRRAAPTEADPPGDVDLFGRGRVGDLDDPADPGNGEPDTLTGRGVRALLSSLGPRRGARPAAAGAATAAAYGPGPNPTGGYGPGTPTAQGGYRPGSTRPRSPGGFRPGGPGGPNGRGSGGSNGSGGYGPNGPGPGGA